MFTGIIESTGTVLSLKRETKLLHVEIESSLSRNLKPGQSVSHDGVCLTITNVGKSTHRVTAVKETLEKSALKYWKTGSLVNLERCLKANSRIDGHFVQGHVDDTGKCLNAKNSSGDCKFFFSYNAKYSLLLINKGSISINGVSLTIAELNKKSFSVCVIPYTLQHTNFCLIKKDTFVNLEFDLLGKYINRIYSKK
ncbi:MAG: riboflavin synthase subunit alpha [Bacteroidetes bacterium RIFCSPLOWO2_02_FULL_36_8]|nr:MAG: riboflavin synthase subunit alpha [Bacteroidetes bacterium RIFCSPLOWO2_02_FULL_36_8]OFY69442.1 MAG: riboflavin synthase subunit alpha [Bacteroidetes bacterium RIFCSPLOWO2_12_FULL_37_12]